MGGGILGRQSTSREDASQRLMLYIQESRERGTLRPGDRLPSERDLATTFGVSRSTVREVLRGLEVMGLIEGRKGSGTFIRTPDLQGAHRSPQAVMEARLAVEPYLTALAAARATVQEVDHLQGILLDSERQENNFENLDGLFHLTIAEYARNDVLHEFARLLHSARSDALWGTLKQAALRRPGTRAAYERQHRAILEALRSRDPAFASQAARDHTEGVYRQLFGDLSVIGAPVKTIAE